MTALGRILRAVVLGVLVYLIIVGGLVAAALLARAL